MRPVKYCRKYNPNPNPNPNNTRKPGNTATSIYY